MDTKKLDRWASLLLDTGKRNNLVNFKDTKASTVEIISPNPDELFTMVESSASFRSWFYYSNYNGLITNEEVIKELLKTAQEIAELYKNGEKLGLSQEELAFYDALTKPEHIKDFYKNEELIALTRELTEMLRRNRTIDWQKKEIARAQMRKMVKRLLKKYKYPPEDYDCAINTVISQCELWTDNVEPQKEAKIYKYVSEIELDKVAQDSDKYGE